MLKLSYYPIIFLLLIPGVMRGQQKGILKGMVFSQKDKQPLASANIIDKSDFRGTVSGPSGYFELPVRTGDTVLVSYLGFKTFQTVVKPGDLERIHEIYLVEEPISLQEVVITGNRLTGILKVDLRLIPSMKTRHIDLHLEEIFGDTTANRLTRINDDLRKILDPVGLLYNWLSVHGKDLRKLRKMKEEDELVQLLARRFDRKIISDLLDIPEDEVYRILILCDYDENFLKNASDFQILEALKACYEKHRLLFELRQEEEK